MTTAESLLTSLRAANHRVSLDDDGRVRVSAWLRLSTGQRAAFLEQRVALAALLQAEAALAAASSGATSGGLGGGPDLAAGDPAPVLFAGRYRVTEADVRDALTSLGDDAVSDYAAGRITKREA